MLLIRSEFVCCKVLIALRLGGVVYKAWPSVALTNGLFIREQRAAHPRLAATTGGDRRFMADGVGLLWVFCGRVTF